MKILKVAFENINSLRGKHEIDFTKEPFKTNALFAITGPTGSGKSTILDVIALALFNQVPRLGRITRNEIIAKGALLTRNQKNASAAVTYSCKNGNFISQWSISTNRNDNLRDYEMALFNADTETLFDLKKSDVPAKNEELIGLSYSQFIKSVLLAQGEFAQFLQAKRDERGELLEKITGTGIYRRLGQLAFEKFKLENQEIKDQQIIINNKTEELLDAKLAEEHKTELAEREKSILPLTTEIEQLQKKISLKESISNQEKEIAQTKEKQEKEREKLLIFDEKQGVLLKNHEKLEPFAQQITHWEQLNTAQQELLTEQKKNENEIKNAAEQKKALQTAVFKLIKKQTTPENTVAALQEFALKVEKLQQQRKEKRSEHKALKQQFDNSIKDTAFNLHKDISKSCIQLENQLKQSENSLNTLKNDLGEIDLKRPENEKKRLRDTIKSLNASLSLQEKIETAASALKNTLKEEEELEKQEQSLPKEIELTTAKKDRYKAEQEKLETQRQNQRLQASLTQHRNHLKEGEACPLCGALEHPYATKLPEQNDKLKIALEEAEKEFLFWNRKNIQQVTELEHVKKNRASLNSKYEKQEIELKTLQKTLNTQLKDRELKDSSSWLQEVDLKEHQLETLELYEKEDRYHEALSNALPLLQKMKEIIEEGTELSRIIENLYGGTDVRTETQSLQNKWISHKEKEKNLENYSFQIEEKRSKSAENLEKLSSNLVPQLQNLGFETISTARNNVLEHSNYAALRSERANLILQIANQKSTLETLEKQLDQYQKEDITSSKEELMDKLGKTKIELEDLREKCENLKYLLKNDEDRLQIISNLKEKISRKEKENMRWRLLNELIGDANGKKFNEFAQHLTLTQLLRLANTRLKDLSDRYRLDTPMDEEDDSLVTIDEHMGGQRRSVKTLSGGETFILSLSMALALSDLASRNVEINSLFIDEGFGTLDPETLDQTLDTLERLQASSSKTIGIISHVDSLKERIATQIQLKRNGQGYSSLKII
ncbi:AAA family ATPase [Flavimarina sp. Hel_I_48]|uniref:AAA family ATPase n=1 Tax=Flavimarina sp. Hel_I_48 TaxID=1392488 RepID=UPI0004DF7D0E|nr:SbcC/MukB-like Walker B domain-containing protein [Flavimarina sp. Hel_I_48]